MATWLFRAYCQFAAFLSNDAGACPSERGSDGRLIKYLFDLKFLELRKRERA